MNKAWWKEAIVYQIYPRSFKDSDGDGVGDLRGVIEKLDYIKSLGVDAVWVNPVYPSPLHDGGYDISDYCAIHPEVGSMQDFDELLSGLHQRGLKIIMDLVLNHSSDEHAWFKESRKSKDNPYRDYYFWRPGNGGKPPSNWPSFFGGSAWTYDEATKEYYLHLFSDKQPDLNWENPAVRKELHRIMKFWLDKGVDGLRLDVISAISKRTSFSDVDSNDFNEIIRTHYANGPRLREFITEARETVWNHYPVMTVGEGPGITPGNAKDYLEEKKGLDMIFHFGHMFMDQGKGGRFDPVPWTMKEFKRVFKLWNDAFEQSGWGSVFLGNHDFPRMVSRWGNDETYWEKSAKLLVTLLLSMRGTPFIYQGDEIGMTNTRLKNVADSKDIETLNGWNEARQKGMDEHAFLKVANQAGRDNARTPIQWSAGAEGFTKGTPWMPVNENSRSINVARQEQESGSVLNYFREMTRVRKEHPVLSYGAYQPVDTDSEKLFVFFRENEQEKLAVVLNFSDEVVNFPSGLLSQNHRKIVGNYEGEPAAVLQPWESLIMNIKAANHA